MLVVDRILPFIIDSFVEGREVLLQQLRNFRFDMMRFDVMHSDRVKQCLLLGLKRLFDGSAARRQLIATTLGII